MEPVSLKELAEQMDMQNEMIRAFYDRETAKIQEYWEDAEMHLGSDAFDDWDEESRALQKAIEGDTQEQRFLPLPSPFEIHEYRIMEDFIGHGVADQSAAERLSRAIRGRGAFRRFKDRAIDLGLIEQWYAYKERRLCEIARHWCEEHEVAYRD